MTARMTSTPNVAPAVDAERPLAGGRLANWLSGGLAAVATVAGAGTFFVPGILTGPAAMNGSARGTALVVLLVAIPALVSATLITRWGSERAVLVWLGATGYLLYNAVMFAFATPFNELFLVYVAMLSLAIWTLVAVLRSVDVARVASRWRPVVPVRPVAVYLWAIAGLNTLAWLATILPALADDEPAAFLAGTGLTTNPVYVQDLAFWLPLMALVAAWLWRRTGWGYLLAGSLLVMYVVEGVGVAADQWFGHAADPESAVVSADMVWVFAALAVIGCVPLVPFLRSRAMT
jgi:hypothetical protein